MMIERIGHINIRTARFAETMAFYRGLFDLRPGPAATMRDQDRNGWLHAADGRPIIHVNSVADGLPLSTAPSSLDHVAFDCRDRAQMAARLDGAGVAYRVVETSVPGLVQFNLVDPNGIRLELTFGHETVRLDPLA